MSKWRAGWLALHPLPISWRLPTAAALAAAVVLLLGISSAAAHEGGPRLILEPNQVSPGGVVLIRGEDLSLDEAMQISLVGDVGRADLVAVTTDGQGHFTVAVEIPADAPVGTYAIEAVTASGVTIRSLVRLVGSPIVANDGAPPGQDEGFPALQPGPTELPAAAPAVPLESAGIVLRPLADPTGSDSNTDFVPLVALAGAMVLLGVLVLGTRGSRAASADTTDLP